MAFILFFPFRLNKGVLTLLFVIKLLLLFLLYRVLICLFSLGTDLFFLVFLKSNIDVFNFLLKFNDFMLLFNVELEFFLLNL